MARCKYGKLKNPSKGRKCKKRRSASRRRGKRGGCKYGLLKSPRGNRKCRRKAR